MKWYWLYMFVVAGLTTVTFLNNGDPGGLLFAIPFNIALYFLPTWAIVAIVRRFNRKPVTPSAAVEPLSISDTEIPQ